MCAHAYEGQRTTPDVVSWALLTFFFFFLSSETEFLIGWELVYCQ